MHPISTGGPVRLFSVGPQGIITDLQVKPRNLTLYRAADIQMQLLAGRSQYAISTAYFEFTNTGVAAPTPAQDQGQAYYAGLSGSGKDFIRVPIAATTQLTASGSNYISNVGAFLAQTAGTLGQFGLTFSQGAGSHLIGVALAASPTDQFADDLVYARLYYATPQPKVDGNELGFSWPLTLTVPAP